MRCPFCLNEDESLFERIDGRTLLCHVCAKTSPHPATNEEPNVDLSTLLDPC